MILQLISFLFLLGYIIWFYTENFKNRERRPPGPLRIPPFGNLIQIGFAHNTAHIALNKLGKKYGDVMSIKMGLLDTVILSSYEAVRNVNTKDEACGRLCTGFIWDRNLKQNIGLAFCEGPSQAETRKYVRDTLKKYGFGDRETMQNVMLDELHTEFIKFMEDEAKSNPESKIHFEPFYFNKCFFNIMALWVIGKRMSYSDSKFQNLLGHLEDISSNGTVGTGLMIAYPFLRHIFPGALGYNTVMKALAAFREFVMEVLHERRQRNYKDNPDCFTDNFLQEMDQEEGRDTKKFTEDHYTVLFFDIIQAATDTTSNVVNFIILLITSYPAIQEKVYQEVMDVIGPSRLPAIKDKLSMPYTQAVILEGLRWSRVIVLGVPRKVTEDIIYRNYCIKKGTTLMSNMHSIFFDETIWGDPEVFRPERFFDSQGNLDTRKIEIIQLGFGAGKRNCFGEVLARDSLFIFLTSLIQHFKFSLPPDTPTPSLEPVVHVTLTTHPYEAIVTKRSQL